MIETERIKYLRDLISAVLYYFNMRKQVLEYIKENPKSISSQIEKNNLSKTSLVELYNIGLLSREKNFSLKSNPYEYSITELGLKALEENDTNSIMNMFWVE